MAKQGRDFGIPGESWHNRKMSTQKLRTAALRDFQLLRRLECADSRGLVMCVTCRLPGHYKKMHAGHYVSRKINATAFDPRNVNPQCPTCNIDGQGEPARYEEWIIRNHGHDVLDELKRLKRTTVRLYRSNILELREAFKQRIKIELQRLEQGG